MGQLEVVGLASAAIGIFTSVECEFYRLVLMQVSS